MTKQPRTGETGEAMAEDALSFARGTIDMHIHSNPHCSGRKNLTAFQAVEQARDAGMAAIVLKCNFFPTGGLAYTLSRVAKGMKVFGMIALNAYVGGINPTAVEKAIFYGEGNPGEFTKIIWMPTFSASTDVAFHRRPETERVEVLRNGALVPEVFRVFDLIAKYDLVLATGHLPEQEALEVVRCAHKQGVSKIVLTHPSGIIPGISIAGQKEAIRMGALVEICFVDTTDYYRDRYGHVCSLQEIAGFVREMGPEAFILSTDLGADPGTNPPPARGMGLFIKQLLQQGLSREALDIMTIKKPAALLGLDAAA
jgi:hypothetical protein